MNIKKILMSISLLSVFAIMIFVSKVYADSTIVVRQADLAVNLADTISNPTKWFMYNDSTDAIDNTLGSFVVGPGITPNGTGSIAFTLGANPMDRKNIATYQFSGTPLGSITSLSFTAYSHSGVAGPNESPYLQLNVDFNDVSYAPVDSWQKRLVYVPSANGSVPQDTWNTFDAINGGNALWWWSGFAANGNKWPDGNTTEYRTWNAIKTAFPNIRIRVSDPWLGIRVGEPGPVGYTGNVDSFTLGTASGTTTFDFEPGVAPTLTNTPTPTPGPFAIPAECSGIVGLGAPIIGKNKSEKINGTSGNDLIFGNGGADTIDGKGGDDCIVGGSGADKLIGGDGNDVLLGKGGADNINAGDNNDIVYGGDGADSIDGGNGKDTLYGEGGADTLKGGNNDDTLVGGGAFDTAKGESGTDTCSAESKNSCEL